MERIRHKHFEDGTETIAIYSEALEMCSEPNYIVLQRYLDRENRRAEIRRIAELTAAWVGLFAFCFLFWWSVARAL